MGPGLFSFIRINLDIAGTAPLLVVEVVRCFARPTAGGTVRVS
jgi:hypothetical protein